jgi:hypothetical protein
MQMLNKLILPVVLCLFFCGCLCAQERNCSEISSLAKMARAGSTARLIAEKQKAGNSYWVQVVFAARQLELDPANKRAATALLILIPKDDAQHLVWITLGDSLCDAEPVQDIMLLGRLRDRLSRDLAKAVLLVPDKMQEYVSYAATAVQDIENDYAVQMETVCRTNHSGFTKAIEQLPAKDRDWFKGHILNPKGCRALGNLCAGT